MTPIHLRALAATALLLQGFSAVAQPLPFDMSPERLEGTDPATPLPPAAVTPQAGARPEGQQQIEAPTGDRRFILPFRSLALGGEYDRRAWNVYLTAEQAAAAASVTLAYQNAIVVAPESSELVLVINNTRIGQERINSPNGDKAVRWDLPAGLLKPGSNNFDIVVNQRHRTDCTLESTYELWTEIDGAGSHLNFSRPPDPPTSATEMVRAIGVDEEGLTHFDMIVPSLSAGEALSPLLQVTQGLAVIGGMPNPQFTFRRTLSGPASGAGHLAVLIGTAAELASLVPDLPPAAQTGPVIAVMPLGSNRAPAIVIAGPTWTALLDAVGSFLAPIVPDIESPRIRREFIATDRWASPNAAFMFGGETLSFAQLGLHTTEFTGRRYRTAFDVAVPSDFYAGGYGEAIIRLDAAHGDLVSGSSRINIFVNGSIASTVPVTREGGGILKHEPIRVTLRHFRPGTNHIVIEAVAVSRADAACLPGTAAASQARFALFDTSTFSMPRFARIGQTPNLSALSGTGFPYSRQRQPASIFMARMDADMFSAAANFLGKVAQVSGAPIALEPVFATSMIGSRDAIFIGEAGQLPASVMSQLNLDPRLASGWRLAPGAGQPGENAGVTLDAWRDRVEDGFLQRNIDIARAWVREKLNMPTGALRLFPETEDPFDPPPESDLLVAQAHRPGEGIWTVLVAPTAQELRLASAELAQQDLWQQVSGRVSTYTRSTREVATVEALRQSFRETIEPSLDNYRLIAANWLSSNLISYALVLIVVSCLLGLTTAAILPWMGRRR